MARFNNAFMNDAQDNKFQSRYNYLLDLLDQGYIVEKMIGNKMSRVEVSPENGLNISYDGENVLSIDPTTGQLVLGSSELSLGDLAYLDTVEEANLGTTIIQGGYIKTDLLTADNIQTGTFYANLVNIKSSSGTDRVEIVGTGINGYLSDVLRVQLEYDRLEFHRAGSSIGNIRTEYVNQSWGGSILGDCLFIESAGNSIAFNAASGSTAPSLVVAPTWVDAPVFATEAINIGQTDPKKWSIYTDSTDDTLYIEESGGSGLSLTSDGLTVNGRTTSDSYYVFDCRTMAGSTGSSSYYPTPENLPSNSLLSIFSYFDDGEMWRTGIFVKGWSGSYAAWRISGPASTSANDNWYLQSGAGSSWRTKCKIWHDRNDGSGSGLNADTVDGSHASAFAAASHTHSYLPLSGGVLTGGLQLSNASGSTDMLQVGDDDYLNGLTRRDGVTIYANHNEGGFNVRVHSNAASYTNRLIVKADGVTVGAQLNMGSNNIVGSTSDCWITARRIGLGVAANSTYTVDASTGYIRAGKYYAGSSGGITNTFAFHDKNSGTGYYTMTIVGGIITSVTWSSG